jgi:hypothetical protein
MTVALASIGAATAGETGKGGVAAIIYAQGVLDAAQAQLANAQAQLAAAQTQMQQASVARAQAQQLLMRTNVAVAQQNLAEAQSEAAYPFDIGFREGSRTSPEDANAKLQTAFGGDSQLIGNVKSIIATAVATELAKNPGETSQDVAEKVTVAVRSQIGPNPDFSQLNAVLCEAAVMSSQAKNDAHVATAAANLDFATAHQAEAQAALSTATANYATAQTAVANAQSAVANAQAAVSAAQAALAAAQGQ